MSLTIYCGALTGRIFAASKVKPVKRPGMRDVYVVSGPKVDVTAQALEAVIAHVAECRYADCACKCLVLVNPTPAAPVVRPAAGGGE